MELSIQFTGYFKYLVLLFFFFLGFSRLHAFSGDKLYLLKHLNEHQVIYMIDFIFFTDFLAKYTFPKSSLIL